jgi:serine/threonine-protein kinase
MEDFVEARIGTNIGQRWTLRRVLGVGGMAAVYEATDDSGSEVAVKILHPEFGGRSLIRERFLREGYVANRVEHAGAVRVLEHGVVDDRNVFLVMERLHGESLGDRIARQGSYPLPELLALLDQVLDVLQVAHECGIVHRDLKPDNLFLTEDAQIKVLDFGVARVLDAAPDDLRTRTGMAMGTLSYMAPEQALGNRGEVDGRIDIFALGATAFRILARRRIHEADSDAGLLVAMATKPAPPLASVAPDVPPGVAAIVDVALAFSRDARYPDARTMRGDVLAVQRGEPPPFASSRKRVREEATQAGVSGVFAATAIALSAPLTASPSETNTASLAEPLVATPLPPRAIPPWLVAVAAVGLLGLGGLLALTFSGSDSSETVSADPEASLTPSSAAAALVPEQRSSPRAEVRPTNPGEERRPQSRRKSEGRDVRKELEKGLKELKKETREDD